MKEIKYTNKFFDTRLNNLLNDIKNHFDISNKGCFVLLANYAIRENIDCSNYVYVGKGKEFRSDTDKQYDDVVYIILARYLRYLNEDVSISDVLSDEALTEKYITKLFMLANCAGISLIENELSSYKDGASKFVWNFVIDVFTWLLVPMEKEKVF